MVQGEFSSPLSTPLEKAKVNCRKYIIMEKVETTLFTFSPLDRRLNLRLLIIVGEPLGRRKEGLATL